MRSFPLEFQKVLIDKQTDVASLSRALYRNGHRVTKQFLGSIYNGQRNAPPVLLGRICSTLQLDETQRRRLHSAAARDYGYEVAHE